MNDHFFGLVTVEELLEASASEAKAVAWFEKRRWPDGPRCPRCKGPKVASVGGASRVFLWVCRDCRRQYTYRTGTIFSSSPIPLSKWMRGAVMKMQNVNALQLSKRLSLTLKSAQLMYRKFELSPTRPCGRNGTALRDEILKARDSGKSYRQIEDCTGLSKTTIIRQLREPVEVDDIPAPARRPGASDCDFCGKMMGGAKEFYRQTRRTKHKFCNHKCYGDFYHWRHRNDACKRCGKKRYEMVMAAMCRGYCPRCYGLMRQFGFDRAAVDLHDLTIQLKKEISSVEQRKHHQHV